MEAPYVFNTAVLCWQVQRSSGILVIGTSRQPQAREGRWHCKACLCLKLEWNQIHAQKSYLFCLHYGAESHSSTPGSLLLPEIGVSPVDVVSHDSCHLDQHTVNGTRKSLPLNLQLITACVGASAPSRSMTWKELLLRNPPLSQGLQNLQGNVLFHSVREAGKIAGKRSALKKCFYRLRLANLEETAQSETLNCQKFDLYF